MGIGISLRLRGKIVLLFGAAVSLLLVAAAVALGQLYLSVRMFEQDVALRQNNAVSVEAVESEFKKQVQEWKDTLLRGKKPEAFEKYWGNFQQRESDVRDQAERLSRNIPDPESAQLLTEFLSAHRNMGDAYRRALQEFKAHDFDSAVGDAAVAGIDRAPTELLTKAKDRLVADASARAAEAKDKAYGAMRLSIALFLLVTSVGVIAFLVAVQKGVSAPLARLTGAMRELASGRFDVILPGLGRKDEIGLIAQAIEQFKMLAAEKARFEADELLQRQNVEVEARAKAAAEQARIAGEREKVAQEQASVVQALAEGLRQLSEGDLSWRLKDEFGGAYRQIRDDFNATMARLHETVRPIVAATREVASGTTDLSQRTEEQAASLEETSASMEEMAATVKKNAENALQANQLTSGSREVADRGGQVVAKAVNAMARIEESSRKISDIIGVIDEIARQTNLLALNAAVEAARAGDAGRGFAVVASEVRSLAQRSSQAAKDIKDLITNSSSQVQEGVGLVNQAGTSLTEITASIKQVADIVAEIASASQEQSTGIDQINKALTQMDEVTQQNSALVEGTPPRRRRWSTSRRR